MTHPHIRIASLCMASLCAIAVGTNARAQAAGGDVANPPLIAEEHGVPPLVGASPALVGAGPGGTARGERVLDLKVVYTEGHLFNPATGRNDKVHLRSYNGTDVSPAAPYVSPTIEIHPGETVRVKLDNQLPADPSCAGMDHHADQPHCFNGTNLHTHGLWVNPAGNGDNVLLSINPGVKFEYEYNIPPDHPSGTFWYHTHRHGSTALQVSSGMAGALIIRGDRLPTSGVNGDVDVLLGGIKERVLVMQQIQYACRTAPSPGHPHGQVKQTDKGQYICNPGDTGVIEDYDQFGPETWPKSGRYTSINGQVLPVFSAVQGQVEHWRMIHAGVRDTISLQFLRAKPGRLRDALPLIKSSADEAQAISANCSTVALPYTLIAADGLTMAHGATTSLATFQPGYRWDALVSFPEDVDPTGVDYCVVDASAPASGSVVGGATGQQLLGFVRVTPGTKGTDPQAQIRKVLVDGAQASAMEPAVKQAVIADLNNGLKLTRFVPHPDIAASEVTGKQELTFFIDTHNPADIKFEVGNTLQSQDVRPYDPDRIDRKLTLGGVDEWTLQSHFVSHPFHIHVNPFQVVAIFDPNGKDVSLPDAVDDADKDHAPDPQYAGLKGVWKDTLWIKSLLPIPSGKLVTPGIYTIVVRTRYQRYIGEYVLHCHILDHEDQGMMQNVAVVLPTGAPAPATAMAAMPGHAMK